MKTSLGVFVAVAVLASPCAARGLVVQVPNSGVIASWPGPRDGCRGNACWYHGTMTYLQIGKHYTPPPGFQHVTPPSFRDDDSCEDENVYCIPSDNGEPEE